MFTSFVNALEDVMQALTDFFASVAKRIAEVFKKLGDFRNHSEKCEDNVCTNGECIHCQTLDANESIYGDSMIGYHHENCGSLAARKRGFICEECGQSFTAGISNADGGL
ncbi:hypothetical protein M199_gp245 [Halogranum tailed virus 1]|uniref:Uncharacterized protein n=1 Tax=Halogranum tailed virus 1 TaxID=1273749 RepID=R4TGQ6_9CAUD|nr:hypothetical protein M199_gp245 [Halogranum tailed virus 1]AGM11421.1 hypothetical protein HGTV1_123 [Halogranum tailed virus 1]